MKVKEIMTSDVACAAQDTNLQDIARMMIDHDCGAIPIVDSRNGNKPVGIVTDRDIVIRTVAEGRNPLDLTARDVMTREVETVRPDDEIGECCHTMERRRIRRAVVTDDRGTCAGIVSQADIALHAPEHKTAELVQEVSRVERQPVTA